MKWTKADKSFTLVNCLTNSGTIKPFRLLTFQYPV